LEVSLGTFTASKCDMTFNRQSSALRLIFASGKIEPARQRDRVRRRAD
jgi:hypothetical protein